MAKTKTEQALIQLDTINATQIIEISKWEEIQNNIIKENPFIEITNNETYIQAKANRTALLKGRTSLLGKNGQEGIIKAKFKSILTGSMELLEGLAAITEPNYDKQQEEVKRYEAIIEEKRLEREAKAEEERLAEEKRIKEINDEIESLYEAHKLQIDELTFDGIAEFSLKLIDLKNVDTEKYEEFEITFFKMLERVSALLNEKTETLTTAEEQRLERIKLDEEREKFEAEKLKTREEERKRQEKIDAENKKKDDEQAEKQKVIDAANKEKEEKLAKEQAKIDAEKERLAKIEDDRLEKIRLEKEAKATIKREKEEAKRLKALQPDKDKAIETVKSLLITTLNEVKDEKVLLLLSEFTLEVQRLVQDYIIEIENLK